MQIPSSATQAASTAAPLLGPAALVLVKQELGVLPSQQQQKYWQLADLPYDPAELSQLVQHYLLPYTAKRHVAQGLRSGRGREAEVLVPVKVPRIQQHYPVLAPVVLQLHAQVKQEQQQQQVEQQEQQQQKQRFSRPQQQHVSSSASPAATPSSERLMLVLRCLFLWGRHQAQEQQLPSLLQSLLVWARAAAAGGGVGGGAGVMEDADVEEVVDLTQEDDEVPEELLEAFLAGECEVMLVREVQGRQQLQEGCVRVKPDPEAAHISAVGIQAAAAGGIVKSTGSMKRRKTGGIALRSSALAEVAPGSIVAIAGKAAASGTVGAVKGGAAAAPLIPHELLQQLPGKRVCFGSQEELIMTPKVLQGLAQGSYGGEDGVIVGSSVGAAKAAGGEEKAGGERLWEQQQLEGQIHWQQGQEQQQQQQVAQQNMSLHVEGLVPVHSQSAGASLMVVSQQQQKQQQKRLRLVDDEHNDMLTVFNVLRECFHPPVDYSHRARMVVKKSFQPPLDYRYRARVVVRKLFPGLRGRAMAPLLPRLTPKQAAAAAEAAAEVRAAAEGAEAGLLPVLLEQEGGGEGTGVHAMRPADGEQEITSQEEKERACVHEQNPR